jgi:hypothetical protein
VVRWRFVPVTVLLPLLGAVLGIDGGPIFQILAVENLGLSPAAIGTAFGVGVISLPLQLWAARLPLARARRNVQLFLLVVAVQSWVLATLVAFEVTGPAATTALVVTVSAEIALSVLFATAWQPLLSARVSSRDRQRLNASWPALARGVLAAGLVLFAALPTQGRAWFLAVVGVLPLAAALALSTVDPVTSSAAAGSLRSTARSAAKERPSLPAEMRAVLLVLGALNLGALPLWLVYLDEVLWPTANLGVVGAVQTVASVAALLAWRPTDGPVASRAQAAAVVTLLGSAGLLLISGPADRIGAQAILIAVTAVTAAGSTTVRVAMLEWAHRLVSDATSVRSFTLLDVVASTSLQVGLLIGGWLIVVSAPGVLDAYRAFVIGTTALAAATVRAVAVRR